MSNSHRLEAQALIEATSRYEPDEIPDIMAAYDTLMHHVGWQDRRSDRRFIVKFHDIFWYTPTTPHIDSLFEQFCNDMYDETLELLNEQDIDLSEILTRQYVGHYQAFILDIPEITTDNAAEIAMQAYDEFPYTSAAIESHIIAVDTLQTLEDTYLERWLEFLRDTGHDELAQRTEEHIKEYNGRTSKTHND